LHRSVKLVSLLRPGHAAVAWLAYIASLVEADCAGLERLVFNEVLPVDVRHGTEVPPAYAGVVESWFTNRPIADAFAARIRTNGDAVQLFVDPLLIHDSGRRPLPNKIMVTLKALPGLSRAQAQKHWRTRHVEIGLVDHNAKDFLQLYIQNHVLESDQVPGSASDFDGMPEYWVDPADLAALGKDAPVMRAIAEDEKLFADPSCITTMLLAEHELYVAPGSISGWPVHESPLQDVLRNQ
jgi:EthD domain